MSLILAIHSPQDSLPESLSRFASQAQMRLQTDERLCFIREPPAVLNNERINLLRIAENGTAARDESSSICTILGRWWLQLGHAANLSTHHGDSECKLSLTSFKPVQLHCTEDPSAIRS